MVHCYDKDSVDHFGDSSHCMHLFLCLQHFQYISVQSQPVHYCAVTLSDFSVEEFIDCVGGTSVFVFLIHSDYFFWYEQLFSKTEPMCFNGLFMPGTTNVQLSATPLSSSYHHYSDVCKKISFRRPVSVSLVLFFLPSFPV